MPKRFSRTPKKKLEIDGCPLRAGDIVRKTTNIGSIRFPERMIVTSVSDIPDIDDTNEGYGKEVHELPYWFFGTDMYGVEHNGRNSRLEHSGAIWVGFVELDPFLGKAKRAVMESHDA